MGLTGLQGLVLLLLWSQTDAEVGILHAVGDGTPPPTKDYCITYNSSWTTLATTVSSATYYELINLSIIWLCSASELPATSVKDKAVVVQNGNCSILDKAVIAQDKGAKLLLIAKKNGLPIPNENRSSYKDLTIPIAFIRYKDVMEINQVYPDAFQRSYQSEPSSSEVMPSKRVKTVGNHIKVGLYSPPLPLLNYSMLIIFLISVFTVALGGYWSGLSELADLRPSSPSSSEREGRKQNDDNVTFTPLTVILFVVICCVMLLLLYFFYKWLVYVIICVFCLASAMSLFNCLSALIRKIPFGNCRVFCCNRGFEVRLIFLAAFCIAVSLTWAVFRNEERWIWILQDILGIAFCLNFIKTLRMPNFKACVILLGLLLLYDVFFVFITPFLTKNGESIMIEVAAGPSGKSEKSDESMVAVPDEFHSTHEKLPVVIRVPRLDYSAMQLCELSFSLLGFGDIIVPGLLVAYCRRFDVRTSSSCIYFISCTIAYAVGMVLTFVVLTVMRMGQPALLYLVPCTLLTSSVIAWRRKEMKKFWNGGGYEIMEHTDNTINEENAITAGDQETQ